MAGASHTVSRRTFGQMIAGSALAAVPLQRGGKNELCFLSAVELSVRLRKKQVSAREVLAQHLAQIERVNPAVNAIVTLAAERAIADALRADESLAKGRLLGPLHGPSKRREQRACEHCRKGFHRNLSF